MLKLIFLLFKANQKQRDAVKAILTGKAHARTYPAKRGDRGFRMEVTE
jgi:hypothetical protein